MPAGSLVRSVSANPGNSSFGMSLYLADLLPDQAFEFFLPFLFLAWTGVLDIPSGDLWTMLMLFARA